MLYNHVTIRFCIPSRIQRSWTAHFHTSSIMYSSIALSVSIKFSFLSLSPSLPSGRPHARLDALLSQSAHVCPLSALPL